MTQLIDANDARSFYLSALEQMKRETTPGAAAGLVKRSDVIKSIIKEIEKCIDGGYSTKQIADAFCSSTDYAVHPRVITQALNRVAREKSAHVAKRRGRSGSAKSQGQGQEPGQGQAPAQSVVEQVNHESSIA